MASKTSTSWTIPAFTITLLLFFNDVAMAANSRAKPVVMPFNTQYGDAESGWYFTVPINVGTNTFNMSLSTSLSRTWLVGSTMCDKPGMNKTDCALKSGGQFDPSKSKTWTADGSLTNVKMAAELGAGVYANSKVAVGDLVLGLKGAGPIGTDTITLKSMTGSFSIDKQSIGVFADEAAPANGYLSLQQMALSLYSAGDIPSPSYHMLMGYAADDDYFTQPNMDYDYRRYRLIFGGYDKSAIDLNQTQQYPLRETKLSYKTKRADETPLAATETVGHRMEVDLDNIIYRWTIGGDTDNSIIEKPMKAIIDTTTPFLWLPKAAVETLAQVSGAVWNETHKMYMYRYCFSDCNPQEDSSSEAMLDLILPQQKLTLDFPTAFKLDTLLWDPSTDANMKMLPVRALPSDDSPIILGRPVLSGTHLWVDYAEKYFGMARANLSESYTPEVVGWSRTEHPPITNTSILAAPLASEPGSNSGSDSAASGPGGSGDSASVTYEEKSGLSKTALIGIGVGGGAAVLAIIALIIFICRRKRTSRHNVVVTPHNDVQLGRHELGNEPAADFKPAPPYYQLQEVQPASGKGYPPTSPVPPHSPFPPHPGVQPMAGGNWAARDPTYAYEVDGSRPTTAHTPHTQPYAPAPAQLPAQVPAQLPANNQPYNPAPAQLPANNQPYNPAPAYAYEMPAHNSWR